MPARGPVRIIFQIIFTFVPILDLWAFYRIQKLRRYLLYVYLPLIAISLVWMFSLFAVYIQELDLEDPASIESFMQDESIFVGTNIILPIIEIGFQILAIYLMYTWSKQWNSKFRSEKST